jgi:hypothetical protein
MSPSHQRPTDVGRTWMLLFEAGNNGLRTCPVIYRLDAADETAFLDDQFALDSASNVVGHGP